MRPDIYWVDLDGLRSQPFRLQPFGLRRREGGYLGRLAIMARPRAEDWLEDEVAGWKAEGVHTVVSLLERDEVTELGLDLEAGFCDREGMEFISFPITDRGVPAVALTAAALVGSLTNKLKEGKDVAIHCRAGIGRSSVIAACVMVTMGFAPTVAFDLIGAARGVRVPDTEGQRVWVENFQATL